MKKPTEDDPIDPFHPLDPDGPTPLSEDDYLPSYDEEAEGEDDEPRRRGGAVAKGVIFAVIIGGFFFFYQGRTPPKPDGDAPRYVAVEAVAAAQRNLDTAIAPHTQYLTNDLGTVEAIPAAASRDLPVLEARFADGVDSWLSISDGWALPPQATDGLPGAADLARYNQALKSWRTAQAAMSEAFAACAGKVSRARCIAGADAVHALWQQAVNDGLDAGRDLVEAAAASGSSG